MLYSLQLSQKKIQPRWSANLSSPIWDLTLQTSASDVTKGHGAKSCPNPRPPTIPCPTCNGPMENGLSSGTTHQISGSTSGPTAMGWEPDSRGPGTPDHGSLDETRDDPIVPELFQRQSPSSRPQVRHTDGLGASGNWHSGQTQRKSHS